MKRCKHLNTQLVEYMGTDLIWDFGNGERTDEGTQQVSNVSYGGSVECFDCGRVYSYGRKRIQHPKWVERMLEQLK